MLKNKKSFEFAISTLIVIFLALLILVVLSLALTGTWKNFWDKIKGYSNNIDNLNKMCQSQCDLGNEKAFCCDEKIFGKEKITCNDYRLKVECGINCKEVDC